MLIIIAQKTHQTISPSSLGLVTLIWMGENQEGHAMIKVWESPRLHCIPHVGFLTLTVNTNNVLHATLSETKKWVLKGTKKGGFYWVSPFNPNGAVISLLGGSENTYHSEKNVIISVIFEILLFLIWCKLGKIT